MRKTLLFVFALTMAAFALPAYADKTFSVAVPAGPLAGGAQSFAVTFTNMGSSNGNSLELDVQSGPLVITDATVPGGIHGTVLNGGKAVQFVNLSPIKTSITVTVNATVPVDCGLPPVQWFAHIWAGSPSQPSTAFTFVTSGGAPIPPAAYPVTTVAPNVCTLAFVSQPANAASGSVITSVPDNPNGSPPVQVARKINGNVDTSFTGQITLSSIIPPAPGVLGGTTSAAAVAGVASFAPTITDSAGGTYALNATSTNPALQATSNNFTIFGGAGPLDCAGLPNGAGGTNLIPPDAHVINGFRSINKDNSTCKLVDYTLTDNIPNGTNTVHFAWDTSVQPGAVFDYEVIFSPVYVDPSTGRPKPPLVNWTNANPVFPGDYVPARNCLSPSLPGPYGTVAGGTTVGTNIPPSTVGAADTIMLTLGAMVVLPAAPFAITIDNEQMEVTSVTAGSPLTLGVTRGRGAAPGNVPGHVLGATVMSTSLPLDSSGLLMRVCIMQQSVKTVDPSQCAGLTNPSAPNPPPACVKVDAEFQDAGDAWVGDQ
jgi:hypothetical protein